MAGAGAQAVGLNWQVNELSPPEKVLAATRRHRSTCRHADRPRRPARRLRCAAKHGSRSRRAREPGDALTAEIEKLQALIHKLLRHRFGRRSEQLSPDQLQLAIEDIEQEIAESEAAEDAAAKSEEQRRRRRAARPQRNLGALPAHLPRDEVVIDVEDKSCPCCNGTMHLIGETRTEMLDIVPAQLRVKVIRRPRYGCRACEEAVVQAPAPERPIDGGMATEALVAHVLISKFLDYLPLYRQSQMLARQGIDDRPLDAGRLGRAGLLVAAAGL